MPVGQADKIALPEGWHDNHLSSQTKRRMTRSSLRCSWSRLAAPSPICGVFGLEYAPESGVNTAGTTANARIFCGATSAAKRDTSNTRSTASPTIAGSFEPSVSSRARFRIVPNSFFGFQILSGENCPDEDRSSI